MNQETKLKLLNWCDKLARSQIKNLERAIWELNKQLAAINVARLKMKEERKKEDDSNQRKGSAVTKSDSIH